MLNLQKKYIISLGFICVLAVLCILLSAALVVSSSKASAVSGTQQAASPALSANAYDSGQEEASGDVPAGKLAADEAKPMYIVQSVGNEVHVIPYGRPDQYRVLEGIDVRTLRQVDQKFLSAGLKLYSDEELLSFLEDFGS